MRTRQSVCAKKARYATAEEALAAARAGEASRGVPLRHYRCDRCGTYHLTSRTKGKWVPTPAS